MSPRTSPPGKTRIRYIIFGIPALIVVAGLLYFNSLLPIITGYAAKNLCSAVFVSGREQAEVEAADLNFSFIKYTRNNVDRDAKSVTSRFLWGRSKAIYREGFGVTLVRKAREATLRAETFPELPKPGYCSDSIPWPMGNILPDTVDQDIHLKLNRVANDLIAKDAYGGKAYAFMVLYRGVPVVESYKPQFSSNTRFLSWSMAKSVINALVGILVKRGEIDIYKPVDPDNWKKDKRADITLNDLMRMQSGLKWNEDYGNRSDVTVMLHCKKDMARFACDKPFEYPAGEHWYYSSGTTNIVSYLLRSHFDNDSVYYSFAPTQLFYPLGITDAVFETDPSGTIVGSSYLYMTARDYARFALLYQQNGVFNGNRILPEGWVGYSRSVTESSGGEYGAFFWLNGKGEVPSAPDNTYMCIGHDGQRIFIMPDQELIVIVLGYSPKGSMDFDRLMSDVMTCL